MKAIAGDRLAVLDKPVVLPRTAPDESSDKPLLATAQVPATARSPCVVMTEHRRTTSGHYVRGFLGCQAVSAPIIGFLIGNCAIGKIGLKTGENAQNKSRGRPS